MQTSHKPLAPANACLKLERRRCEERSDEAIHSFFARRDGLLRCARNDGAALARNDGVARARNDGSPPGARPGCWLTMAGRSVLRNRRAAEMVVQADANDVVLEADLRRSGDGSHTGAATRE